MKVGWQVNTLGDVCEMYQPKTISVKDMMPDGEHPVFGANGIIGRFNKFNHEEPQLLITCRGATCGSVNISEPKSWITGNAMVVKPKTNNLLIKFLEYFFHGGIDIQKAITGAAQPQITRTNLEPLQIAFPSDLNEQQRIVAILNQAFEGITKARVNAQQNLQNARTLFESHLQSVFNQRGSGWVEKSLKEITTVLGDGLHGTPKYKDDGEYHFINGNNLNDGVIEFKKNTKRVTIYEYNKHKKNLTNRTILVSINGTLGKVAFYNGEKIILGKSACYFNLKEDVDKNFVKHIFSSPYFLGYAHNEATGATIKNVSLKSMREFKLPIPSLPEQTEIVLKVDSLRAKTQRLEAIYQRKITLLDELKKSLLQQAFAGEL